MYEVIPLLLACIISISMKRNGWIPSLLGVLASIVILCQQPRDAGWLVSMTTLSIGALAIAISPPYLKNVRRRFYPLLLVFLTGMLGVCASRDMLQLYASLEIATVSSMLIIAHEEVDCYNDPRRCVGAAAKYLMLNISAGVVALIGILISYSSVGTLNIFEIHRAGALPVILILIGLGTKGGLVPLHAWLPDAYSESPTPVTILLAGAYTEIALFSIYMLFSRGAPEAAVNMLIVMGLLSIALGSFMMFIERDLKRVLAYSSVEQSGLIAFGIAAGSFGSALHIINHMMMKSLLYLCSGAILMGVATKRIDEMGGLGKRMPVIASCFFIGMLAISGIPPFNGFVSEYWIFADSFKLHAGLTILAILCTFPMFASYVIVAHRVFLGEPKVEKVDVPWIVNLCVILLSIGCIAAGVYPAPLEVILGGANP